VAELENKNYELGVAYKDKTKAHQDIQFKYNSLKAQKMTADARVAASDDAEQTLHMTGHFAADHSRRHPLERLSTLPQSHRSQTVNRLSTSMSDSVPGQTRRSRMTWPSQGQVLRGN
jgi:hypothetical protein